MLTITIHRIWWRKEQQSIETLEDETVTIRERDSMEQRRVGISELASELADCTLLSLLEGFQSRILDSNN